MPSRSVVLCALIAFLLGTTAGTAAGTPYRDTAHHFTLDLPEGWQVMSTNEIDQINAYVSRLNSSQPIRYETGFRRKGTPPGSYPYILVQWQPGNTTGTSYDEIEQSFAKELKAAVKKVEGSLSDVAKNLAVGSAALDRSRNRVITRVQMDVNGVGTVQGISVGHIGAEGLVLIHSYASQAEFEKWLPTFNQLNDSFRYDAGYTFTPDTRSSFARIIQGAAIWGVAGGIGGGLVALWMVRFRKKGKPKEEPREPA